MATEKSEPKYPVIVGLAVFVITALLGIRLLLQQYYIAMYEDEQQRKYLGAPHARVTRARAEWNEHLRSGDHPIERAMQDFASGSRPNVITIRPSTDIAPLQGWAAKPTGFVPHPPEPVVEPVVSLENQASDASAPLAVSDAGQAASTDAAPTPTAPTTQPEGENPSHP